MSNNTKKFTIPSCLEAGPQIFGLSLQTLVFSLALGLAALIMITKSFWLTMLLLAAGLANLKLEKKIKSEGGLLPYLMLKTTKQKNIRVNSTIKELIQANNGK